MERHEKKQIIMNRICRVLTSTKDDGSECILGQDAQRIVDVWFRTVNSHFGGKTPEECLDMDYEEVLEYVDYLDRSYMHDKITNAGDGTHRGQAFSMPEDPLNQIQNPD